jgi:hypothetical protein
VDTVTEVKGPRIVKTSDPYAEPPRSKFEDKDPIEKVKKLRGADEVDQVFGTTLKQVSWTFPLLKMKNGSRLKVTRYYFTEKAAFDVCSSETEFLEKKEILNAVGISFIGVVSGSSSGFDIVDGQTMIAEQSYALEHPNELHPKAEEIEREVKKVEAKEAKQTAKIKAQTKAKRHKR